MKRDAAIRKISSLLGMAEHTATSEQEVGNALLLSQKLLHAYNVTLDDVKEYRDQVTIITEVLFVKQRAHVWDKYILSIIETFFHVTLLRGSGGECLVVGERAHVHVAIRVYAYLKAIFMSAYKAYRRRNRWAQAQAFYMGLYTGLYRKLQPHDEECVAVKSYKKDIDEYIQRKYGRIGTCSKQKPIVIKDERAYIQGEAVGNTVEIHTGDVQHALSV